MWFNTTRLLAAQPIVGGVESIFSVLEIVPRAEQGGPRNTNWYLQGLPLAPRIKAAEDCIDVKSF